MGCFYIESPGMRNLLQKLRVNSFEKLTAASSIIRPGVASSGMMQAYIKRHNGKEAVTYLHPKLKEVLYKTYGIMIYKKIPSFPFHKFVIILILPMEILFSEADYIIFLPFALFSIFHFLINHSM